MSTRPTNRRPRRRPEATRRPGTDTACDRFRSILPGLMTRRNLCLFAFLFVLGLPASALVPSQALIAQSVVVKLATVVPQGSIWDKNLKQMGEEWAQATDGRVALTVFGGGSQGDESTVLRK